MSTQGPFRLRPGCPSDPYACASIYLAAFQGDSMLDILFPEKHLFPTDLHAYVRRIFAARYWSLEWRLTMAVDEEGRAVGFTLLDRPPHSHIPLPQKHPPPPPPRHQALQRLLRRLRPPTPLLHDHPRRLSAWYLSTLAVYPQYQGLGLGRQLIAPELQRIDARGEAAWLVSLYGKDTFYAKFGFEERARMNVDEMSAWDGGSIMFRE
ncbi:hypothetical protein PT974_11222 [Cladobotryum mycophilum]|uniref:N-acetyltransferase domain-containing protein n=1 Tax=Cladobotryum mycophilum TaxID=491253 RepID=A0ABR0S4M8_9HYPO